MKLFYATGACSLSPHIVLRELGIPFELVRVDLKTKKTQHGEDFGGISPKGYVPHIILDSGEALTEGVAIVQYFADLKPEKNLAPRLGTFDRVKLQEWLHYIGTELHKSHFPLIHPAMVGATAEVYRLKLSKGYDYISDHLKKNKFLMGDDFTVADAYLFTVLNWATFVKIDLSHWPQIADYFTRVAERPAVRDALKAEGLV